MPEAALKTASATIRLPRIVSALLDSRALQFVLLTICALVLAKRASGIAALGVDSWAPMLAAMDFLSKHDANALFESLFFDQGIKFQYPPASLLLLEPLYAAGLATVTLLNTINYCALMLNGAITAVLAWKLSADILSRVQRRTVSFGVFFVSLFYEPILLGYTIGQIQVVLNLLFGLACLLLLSGRGFLSGLVIGVATAVKPQFGPLFLLQLAMKRWKFSIGFVLVTGLLGMLALWMYGWESHRSYLEVLSFLSQRGEAFHLNESVNGVVQRLIGNGSAFGITETLGIPHSEIPPYHPTVTTLTRVAMALFLLLPFVVFALTKGHADELLMFCLGAASFVLASPIAWTHHYGILLPIYLILFRRILDAGRQVPVRVGLLSASFLMTGIRFPEFRNMEGWMTVLHAPVFFGACFLTALLASQIVMQARSAAPQKPEV